MSDGHRVVLGDCLDPLTGLASLPDKSVSHVICDPPYEAEAHTLGRRGNGAGEVCVARPLTFDPITEEQRKASAQQIGRVVRRWVAVFCQVEAAMLWRAALEAAGLVYRRAGVWLKPNGAPQFTGDRPGMGYETIVFAHAPGRSAWNGGGRHAVWSEPIEKVVPAGGGSMPSAHPTQKPLDLMESLVRDFTDPGELICDPFSGSGTTGVACKRLGRRFIGWEKSEPYWRIAQKRIDAAREQLGIFDRPRAEKPRQLAIPQGDE